MTEQVPVAIGAVAREIGLSPSRIRQLTDDGVFPLVRTAGGHRRYVLDQVRAAWLQHRLTQAGVGSAMTGSAHVGETPTVSLSASIAGLDEDAVWRELLPQLAIKEDSRARTIAQYVFTEMLNNAIDHSDGTEVRILAWSSKSSLIIDIIDDGIGVFRRLAEGKGLPDLFASVQELTKGKQTTSPDQHSGEGIFFSSKAVDVFSLASNGVIWTVDNLREDHAVGTSATNVGTLVHLEIDPHTELDLGELFGEFSEDSQFVRTRPVVKLFTIGVRFVSRSEAKRLLVGMDKFTGVEFDFTGVEVVGQGFVDELFRVWPNAHPETVLTPTNMNAAVEFMVTRGLPDAVN
jgi:hypothetical protein